MKNNILYICIGPSASGKTTFAEQMLASADNNNVRVSRDEYRYMWKNAGLVSNKIELLINKRIHEDVSYFLSSGFNVIYDATNLRKSYLQEIVEKYNTLANIEFVLFDVDLDTCIERDSKRKRSVGADVIKGQFKRFEELKKNFDFSALPKKRKKYRRPLSSINTKYCICVDMDGTLADLGPRDPYETNGVINDQINLPVKMTVEALVNYHGNLQLFIVSGREEKTRKQTEDWLKQHKIKYNKVFLRKNGDFRRDSVIKNEIYDEITKEYQPLVILDDRAAVVDALRERGFTVFQVNEGNF